MFISNNNLTDRIPNLELNLTMYSTMDLSSNKLEGRIPSSLSHIDRLTWLDLSNNELYGKIPIGTQLQTFGVSGFEGNSNLCGEPLDRKYLGQDPPKPQVQTTNTGDDNSVILEALYMSMRIGIFTGFVGLAGSLLLQPSWRETYSKFLNTLILKVFI
ncbi:hypothetical protein KIW84_065244 [Lathyrus oleraceus]|uniref:Uncharacterized protein n=1 Tax=Pisum sativum TaxID=3888 RepID=A0A9D4WEH4_PEA|nr:hypothetical protein KIW84_UN0578 [Pisum sativum]KAI5400242.1 hypothetical protein KIW84_065242 [Pisum sativum]KAI5400245.1 hypothetical protein KIW84_065244 [Pisum sativum]